MAFVIHTSKLHTTAAFKYLSLCTSCFHYLPAKPLNVFQNFPNFSIAYTKDFQACDRAFLVGKGFSKGLGGKRRLCASASLAERERMEQQFEEFRQQLEESGSVRERLRGIVSEIDSATREMQAKLLQVHYSTPSPEVLEKAKVHIGKLKELYAQLAEVIKGCPGQYYRYHDHWRNQTHNVVFLIVFLHWLETGNLLSHAETQNLLGLNTEVFGIDLEDYLIGLCNMSSELPRYVVNQVTIGDYECPKRVSRFLSDLYAAFRILNLRNDMLRKRFDGMKYDLKKVEEVLYDVKIRRLDTLEITTDTKPDAS